MWSKSYSMLLAMLLFVLLFLTNSSRLTFAQENHCDPGLHQTSDSYGYRLRGDRCEGIYIREVGGTTLQIVSLTALVEDFNPATNKDLLVQWVAPGNGSIRLRAYGLRHKLHYRMDSLRPGGSTSYSWSTNLLASLNLKKHELGLVAWVSQLIANNNRDVYLPVTVSQQSPANRSRAYNLTLLPGVELEEVFISLAPLGRDGKPGSYIKNGEALNWGYYPAERPITIAIPELKTTGIYYMEIGAKLRAGGSATEQVWFYHHN
jgi:hypothetical protein